jgi:hypothetical protein
MSLCCNSFHYVTLIEEKINEKKKIEDIMLCINTHANHSSCISCSSASHKMPWKHFISIIRLVANNISLLHTRLLTYIASLCLFLLQLFLEDIVLLYFACTASNMTKYFIFFFKKCTYVHLKKNAGGNYALFRNRLFALLLQL